MKKIIITGNMSEDPELKLDKNGNKFVVFSVGIEVGTKASPKTDWVDVICEGRLADIVYNYGKRNTKVLVEGFPHVNVCLNQANETVGRLKITATTIELLNRVISDITSEIMNFEN